MTLRSHEVVGAQFPGSSEYLPAIKFTFDALEYLSEDHLFDGEMHFEEPAWNEDGLRHYWSSVADDHMSFTDDTLSAIWVYANRVAIHEFGHTFFIPDLPDTTHLGIMNNVHKWDVVEPDDLSYLMQLYLDHTRH